jgi:hypothetical protein
MPPTKKKEAGSTAKRKAESDVSSSATAKRSKANPSFPGKIGKTLTLAQLREEAEARGMDLGNVKHDKAYLLRALGEGSLSVVVLNRKQKATGASQSKKSATSTTASKKKEPTKTGSKAKSTPTKAKTSVTTAASKITTEKKKKKSKAPPVVSALKKTNAVASKKTLPGATSSSSAPKLAPKPAKVTSSVSAPAAKSSKTSTSKKSVPTSTSAAGTSNDYPRITNKLTLAQLREEAAARQLDPKRLPKLKGGLLHHLVDGSIHVKETKTYKEYQDLLKKLDGEKAKLYQESLKQKQATDARKEAVRIEKHKKEEKEQQEQERQRLQIRNEEKANQLSLHSHSFPQVHCHSLVKTNSILTHGRPRLGVCDLCDTFPLLFSFEPSNAAGYTCEECDWDICRDCFDSENKSDAEKKRIRLANQKRQESARKKEEAEERRREEELRNRWDAHKRFKANILKPAAKHKKPSSKLKYTVWCSDGYDNDGWHSYQGEPMKEFDTIWATKKEANDRAEFLFFWKNPWGISPNQVIDCNSDGDLSPESDDGMDEWSEAPPDSTRWTVGVVPAASYRHCHNASQNRHDYDDGREPKGYEGDDRHYGFL